MTTFLGMDTAQVRTHAKRLHAASGEVAELRHRLDAVVGAAGWTGPDADQLRGRWNDLAISRLSGLCGDLTAFSDRAGGEADAQEAASHGGHRLGRDDGPEPGAAAPDDGSGYLHRDHPWIPDWLEHPAEGAMSDLAELVSDGIGWGVDLGFDGISWAAGRLGLDTDGIDQVRGEFGHVGGLLEDWATGERVPTIAELASGALLVGGSAAIAPVELFTDTGFLDPRTDVTVHRVGEVPPENRSTPRDLADLIVANDEARAEMLDRTGAGHFEGSQAGQIRIQAVQTASGGEGYIVHAPPTGGEGIYSPDSWGAQGNSAGWGSAVRAMSGQESAAMADIRAAMNETGPDGQPLVPPGADVMFVGHSQGGLTAAQLSADPSFNNTSGAPGSYNVTHSFSVGAPVETVVPAQSSTQVVNVAHNPVWEPTPQVPGLASPSHTPVHIADPVPRLDLDGYRIDGSHVSAPNVQEAWIDAPQQTYGQRSQLDNAHDSVLDTSHGPDPTGGYHGSVRAHADSHPVLSELQQDVEGNYVGHGVTVVSDQVVEVGREDVR